MVRERAGEQVFPCANNSHEQRCFIGRAIKELAAENKVRDLAAHLVLFTLKVD